eukprot:TRINITY_DN3608_c0_g1_i1.p1 TRINITY_DN3608_c0_g1~~TRINITY_DN3608_c0_g1_i1.p1  ORF type:complete len:402 (+),score=107.18 TRINITY_DN3608_c0_g1_i1:193-1398(+)
MRIQLAVSALVLVFAVASTLSQNTFYPVPIRDGLTQYLAFGPRFLAFKLPSMSLIVDKLFSQDISFSPPVVLSENALTFSNEDFSGSYRINTITFELTSSDSPLEDGMPLSGALFTPTTEYCIREADETYCFRGGRPATITKSVGEVDTVIQLQDLDFTQLLKLDMKNGLLYVTAQSALEGGRRASNMIFYIIQTSPFVIRNGPQELISTEDVGCPVAPRLCGVDVLTYADVEDSVFSYVYTRAIQNPDPEGFLLFQVTLQSFSFDCGYANATIRDDRPRVAPVIFQGRCGGSGGQPQMCNGTGVCGPRDMCCQDFRTGKRCYNPDFASCVLSNDGKTVLCGRDDDACNGVCFNRERAACVTDEDGKTFLCGKFDGGCNGVCFDDRVYDCRDGELVYTGAL